VALPGVPVVNPADSPYRGSGTQVSRPVRAL